MSRIVRFRAWIRGKLGLFVKAQGKEGEILRKLPWLTPLTPLTHSVCSGGIKYNDFGDDFVIGESDGVVYLIDDRGNVLSSAGSFRSNVMFEQIMQAFDKLRRDEREVHFIVWRGSASGKRSLFKIYRVLSGSMASKQMLELYRIAMGFSQPRGMPAAAGV